MAVFLTNMDVMKHLQQGTPGDGGPNALDPLERQASAWLHKLASGTARKADARALARWCATSHAHRQAFTTAYRKWTLLRVAAKIAGEDDAELAALRRSQVYRRAPVIQRRVFLGGAVAATTAGVLLLNAPMALLPSLQSLMADYKTGIGEQRQLALTDRVTVDLNTRSSVSLRSKSGRVSGINLIDGEVAVDVARAIGSQVFTVFAGGGGVRAVAAVFEVRQLAEDICVTCREGLIEVVLREHQLELTSGQQLSYGRDSLQTVNRTVSTTPSTWRQGILSFQKIALAQVLEEINRYRPGRVILIGKSLAGKPVSGRFQIHDLDKAIAQIQRLFKLEVTSLPGGVILLS